MDRSRKRTSQPATPRLEAVAGLVCSGSRVADIGTGDGGLPLRLLASSRATHCIAVERTPEAAPGLDALRGLAGLEIRYGDGMSVLCPEDRLDVLVMSGFGARSMLRVLERDERSVRAVRRLVLQPQTEVGLLRRWLVERGVGIVAERIVIDRGRFYQIVAAEPGAPARLAGHPSLEPDELIEAGPLLVRSGDPLFAEYWRRDLRRIRRILSRAPARPSTQALVRRRDLATKIIDAVS